MTLSRTFEAVTYKQLVACDLPNRHSHQHELTGVSALKTVFGTDSKIEGRLTWVFFTTGEDPIKEENAFTFYDARAKSAARTRRSEWRLYYHGDFLARANIGDLLVVAKTRKGSLLGLIFTRKSEAHREVVALFALGVTAAFTNLPSVHLESHVWDARQTPILARWFKIKAAK